MPRAAAVTANTLQAVTIADFRRFAMSIRPDVVALLDARTFAEAERVRVAALVAPLLARHALTIGSDVDVDDEQAGQGITDERDLYRCGDELRVRAYYDARDALLREHGFTGPKDHCPALIAESAARAREAALVAKASQLFGVDFNRAYGDNRKRLLDTLIAAAVQ